MSTLEHSIDWLERIGDRANPILVKETRQSLKSRQFVVTFMLLLAASWFLFMLGLLLGGDAIEYGAIGNQFFQFFYWILALAVMVIVPFGAYRSLLAERDQKTYDLLSITTLTPQQIVWGKLLSALVQVLIFYSAIAPFIAFTSLLQGFDFLTVAVKLVMTLLLSMLVVMAAIAASAMTRRRQFQAFSSLVMLFVLFQSMSLLALVDAFLFEFDLSDPGAWWFLGMAVLFALSYFLLFHKVAAAHLTFESDDRTSGIRLVCSGQFFLLWAGLGLLAWLGSTSFTLDEETIVAAAMVSFVHWTIAGLVAVTEDSHLSRRIRRNLPASPSRRLLWALFLQGGNRGYLYVLLHVALLLAISLGALTFLGVSSSWSYGLLLATACYLVAYLGMACALGRWCFGLSGDIRPGHIRVMVLIIVAVGCIAPYVPFLWGHQYRYGYSPLMLPNPFATLAHFSNRGSYTSGFLTILGLAAGVGLLVNLRAMRRGVAEVVFADVKQREIDQSPEH